MPDYLFLKAWPVFDTDHKIPFEAVRIELRPTVVKELMRRIELPKHLRGLDPCFGVESISFHKNDAIFQDDSCKGSIQAVKDLGGFLTFLCEQGATIRYGVEEKDAGVVVPAEFTFTVTGERATFGGLVGIKIGWVHDVCFTSNPVRLITLQTYYENLRG